MKAFEVKYAITETYSEDKKGPSKYVYGERIEEKKVVFANNGNEAIEKVKKSTEEPYSFVNEETKKTEFCHYSDFEIIELDYLAEEDI